ncbi:homeodomain-like protein [Tanacetum coccineum]
MAEYSQKWHNGTSRSRSTETSDGLAAIQAQLNNLGREIKKVNEKVYEKDSGSFTLPCFINNICFDNALVDLRASVSVMPFSTYFNLELGELAHTKLTVELADRTVKYPKGIAKNVLVGIGKFVFPITLRIREERIIFKSVKPASSLIKRVYMLSLRERMELDLEARLMGETLVINRSLDPLNGDYIELNDLNEPFELRRNQGDDLMPTIEEGEVIEEFRTRDDELDTEIDDYLSYCDYDKKIHIEYAHNLKFSCMIGFEFSHVNFFPLLYVNVMSKKFHNYIMKDNMVYKGNNVVGTLMNVPIFVGTFSVVTDFAILEDMDAYRDEGMGDVIFGEPFLREVKIKVRRFKGMITIYNVNESVTYQMVRSHLRFKHHTNELCNKIPPLLKVSIGRILGYGYGVSTSCTVLGPRERNIDEFLIFYTGPRERNIDEYWWRIYKFGDLEVLES